MKRINKALNEIKDYTKEEIIGNMCPAAIDLETKCNHNCENCWNEEMEEDVESIGEMKYCEQISDDKGELKNVEINPKTGSPINSEISTANAIYEYIKEKETENMSMYEKIAKLFDLELEEEFRINENGFSNYYYKFTERRLYKREKNSCDYDDDTNHSLMYMINYPGEVIKISKPLKDGDYYYTPVLHSNGLMTICYHNTDEDKFREENNFICRTPEEAIEKTKIMLEVLKNL